MGDPRKLKKKYEVPKKKWDTARIEEEKAIKEKYGLKNIREVWIAKEELRKIRREVRKLFSLGSEASKEGKKVIEKAKRMGYIKNENVTIESLLNITVEDILERRLQTLVFRKGFAKTIKQARQFITHGHIAVNGKRVKSPGMLVPVSMENKISFYKKINLPEKKVEDEKLKEAIEKIEGGEVA
jgi:small subunit ribosomal protein S4